MNTNIYRVKIGDLEYPGEFADLKTVRTFAQGADFVLDNIKAYADTRITIDTYEITDDPNTGGDITTLTSSMEF